MILGEQFGGVIPGGVASATPILLPSQPWPVVLTSLFFEATLSGASGWEGAIEWVDGEGNVFGEVFSESNQSGDDVTYLFFSLNAWRPSQSFIQDAHPTSPQLIGHSVWRLPRIAIRPGERIQLRTRLSTPSEATLSSLRYRFERVSFRKD